MLRDVRLSNRQVKEPSLVDVFGNYISEDFVWGNYPQYFIVTINMGLPVEAQKNPMIQMMALLTTT